ncbi:histidine ammonia-lyase [Nakamurella sp. UYEF19]|uniref:aromatic amino acid lyase n=1 Tax=Nakamurella sp. UYEF19 TaxID=1756392 RepID=UPI00339B72A1
MTVPEVTEPERTAPEVRVLEVNGPADLDQAAIAAVAVGRRIHLTPALLERIGARRVEVLAALQDGRAVYGVNTGMGAQSSIRLTADQQARHERDLLPARAVGGPPWLPPETARAVLAVRLRTFLLGDAGVSPELVTLLVRFLEADIHPAIPATGVGSAGEIIPLAHAFGPLLGVGSVLEDESSTAAAEVLRVNDITAIELGAKEGVALLQGVPGTTAQALLLARRVIGLVENTQLVVALGLVAAAAPQDVHHAGLARADPELAQVNTVLRQHLLDSDAEPRSLQAPVSFRVAGAVLAHLTRAVHGLQGAVDRALDGITDSPAFLDGDFHATPGFHGLDLAAHLDAVSVALVHAAEVSAARTHRMLEARVTGLVAQLAADPEQRTGLIAVHKRAVGVVHQLRRTTSSSLVGSMETSFGQEDVQTFSWEAAANARTALEGCVEVLACELLTASHAVEMSGRRIGAGLAAALAAVRTVVEPIRQDRSFGPDIEALRHLLGASLLLRDRPSGV